MVQQALVDLINFTTKNQKLCQMEDFKDKDLAGAATKKSILELLRTLLDTAQLFKNKGLSEISTKCAFAMSVIGALDPNKFSLKSIKEQVIVIHDFTDYKEYAEFLRYFMENIVIKSFWASNSPVKQLYSAYSMQKFLGVLKLDERVLTATQDPYAIRAGNGGQVDTLSQEYFVDIWNKFSDIGKSTLTPLLSSKYVPPPIKYEPLNFPYFKLSMSYEKWLVDLTSNLLNRALRILENGQIDTNSDSNSPKAVIFRTCSILVRDQDISVCTYLFKYVSLSLIINGDNTSFNNLKTEFLSILQHDSSKLPPDRSELLINCFQSVFEVLDYFNEWYSVATQYLNDNVKASTPLKKSLGLVQKFLEHLPMSLIAKKSAECDSYERTILYLEKCYREDIVSDDEVVPTLQRMYSNINDYDSLSGILKKFSTNNLQEKLSTFQYNENWSLAQESFQVLSLIGDKQDKVANNAKLLKSLSDHAFYEEVLSNLGSKVNFQRDNLNEIPLVWSMTGLSASVSSGNFDELEKWMYITESISTKLQDKETMIQYQVAKSLKFLKEGDKLGFERCIDNVYETIGTSLVSSMSSSSISKNSLLINQLHALYDLTSIATRGGGSPDDFILRERLTNIDQSFETQWKILSIHYATNVAMGKNENVLGEILLRSSETARKNERLDVATRCIMKAMVLNEKEANIQYTELLWAQGRQTEAIKNLHSIIKDGEFKNTQQRAKAQLQYAVWLDESNHSSSTTIIDEYSKAYKLESIWDKPYYDLGKYYSKIMESKQLNETFSNNSGSNSSGPDMSGYYEQQTIRYFLKALALGPTFIFEALPKLITIWLDFAQLSQTSEDAQRRLQQIVQDIKTSIDTIPIYVWYTAITQLLLRIGHSHEPSSHLLMAIVSNLIQAYPKYSLWYVLSHLNSNDKLRRKRVSMTLSDSQKKKRELVEIIMGAQSLFLSLIKIASHDIKKSTVVRKMLLSRDFQTSFNLTEPCTALVIPVRSNLEIRLPLGKYNPKTFTAFPKAAAVTFNGFDDVISIFQSLQKPKQVTIRGSDYNVFRLLLKRDDTRKDAKVVEFTTMINRLLLSNNETRKRNLFITNYSVVSLAENLGVIEFVQDVATMKSVINDQRQRMGVEVHCWIRSFSLS